MKQNSNEYDSDLLFKSIRFWNVDRVCFLINQCGIKPKELLKSLGLEKRITVDEIKSFSMNGSKLSEKQLEALHFSINQFFRT